MEEVKAAVQNVSNSVGIEMSREYCANFASVFFLHSIGPEALDVYNTFVLGVEKSKDKLEDAMKNFEAHFIPNVT